MKYKHKKYGNSIAVDFLTQEPLPSDRRKKPWPTIRKYKLKGLKTQSDFMKALIERSSKAMRKDFVERIFSDTKFT